MLFTVVDVVAAEVYGLNEFSPFDELKIAPAGVIWRIRLTNTLSTNTCFKLESHRFDITRCFFNETIDLNSSSDDDSLPIPLHFHRSFHARYSRGSVVHA